MRTLAELFRAGSTDDDEQRLASIGRQVVIELLAARAVAVAAYEGKQRGAPAKITGSTVRENVCWTPAIPPPWMPPAMIPPGPVATLLKPVSGSPLSRLMPPSKASFASSSSASEIGLVI